MTPQSVALDIVRRAKTTPTHELGRYMRCKDCSDLRGYTAVFVLTDTPLETFEFSYGHVSEIYCQIGHAVIAAAGIYTALVVTGFWQAVLEILTIAGAIYTFIVARFEGLKEAPDTL